MRETNPNRTTGYKHKPGEPGNHLRTLDGQPRRQFSPAEIEQRMARVSAVQVGLQAM